jgi:hypothetical protein
MTGSISFNYFGIDLLTLFEAGPFLFTYTIFVALLWTDLAYKKVYRGEEFLLTFEPNKLECLSTKIIYRLALKAVAYRRGVG